MTYAWLSAGLFALQLLLLRALGSAVTPLQMFVVAGLFGGIAAAVIVVGHLVVAGSFSFPLVATFPIVVISEIAGWASFVALFVALRAASVGPVTVVQELGPVMATGAAWLIFEERLSAVQMFGFVMAICGAVLVQRG